MSPDGGALIVVVAGEPSGDRLGAGLIDSLQALAPGRFAFAGVGGPVRVGMRMEGAVLASSPKRGLFTISHSWRSRHASSTRRICSLSWSIGLL